MLAFKDGLVTRGVLVDWPRFKNVPYMGDDEAIYAEDLDAWEKKSGVKIESGDCVLVRTGRWKRVAEKGPLDLNKQAPGLYASAGRWLKDRDIALLGSDVVQDVRPSRVEGVNQPIHQLSLIHIYAGDHVGRELKDLESHVGPLDRKRGRQRKQEQSCADRVFHAPDYMPG